MIEEVQMTSDDGSKYTKLKYTRTEDTPKIGIIFGHFAPFTGPNGHGRMLEKLEDFGCNKFIIAIPTSKQSFDTDRNMFSVEQRLDIAQSFLDKEYPGSFAVSMRPTKPEYQIGRLGKKAYELFGGNINPIFCFGPDRADMIGLCESYGGPDTHRYEAVIMKDRGEKSVSGTKMRHYIIDGNKDDFMEETGYDKEMTDKIFNMYEKNIDEHRELKESMKRYTKRLREGGNLSVEGKNGVKSATKLQVAQMEPEEFENFKKDLLQFLLGLNDKFKEFSGYPIWNDTSLLAKARVFSGSTRAMFLKDWKTYSTFKKKVGDIDVQLPEAVRDDFRKFLVEKLPNMTINGLTIYGVTDTATQGHALLQCDSKYPGVGAEYIQLDFEYTPFENDAPTPFATFAHYSSWQDIENNIKGVFIKYLMRALIGEIDTRDVVLVTKTGRLKKDKASLEHMKRFLAFSVDRGVRMKYKPYIDPKTGEQMEIDGKECWTEAASSESTYTQNLPEIYGLIFHEDPSDQDIKDLHSFVRLLKLMKEKLEISKVRDVYVRFIDLLWGAGSQKLSAFDRNEDIEWKNAANDKFIEIFPEMKELEEKVNKEKEYFYETYENRQRGD